VINYYALGAFLVGLIFGAVLAWIIFRLKTSQKISEGIQPYQSELAVLGERIKSRESELQGLTADKRELEMEVNGLREKITDLKQVQTELETLLHKERQAMEEKIALLNEASKKMEDAFKALSAECLRNNNQQFLDLAKATLEKFQSEAKGDLEQRQKAVEVTIAPLKETLE